MAAFCFQTSNAAALRNKAFQSGSPLKASVTARTAPRSTTTTQAINVPKDVVQRAVGTLLAAQISLLPLAGVSYAALDTETTKKGLGATIEYSDITKEDQQQVLAKLKDKILPEAKEMLAKVGKGEGSNYPASIAKELETVETEVSSLIDTANDGGDMSNVKSAASGIEQQINALKALIGFD